MQRKCKPRLKIVAFYAQKAIDRKIGMVLSLLCCMKRNQKEVCALDANKLYKMICERGLSIDAVSKTSGIDISLLGEILFKHGSITIGDALKLKEVLSLTNAEAIDIFLS